MQKHIRKESNLQAGTTTVNTITTIRAVRTSTFLGRDFPGSRLQVIRDEGNTVKAGEPVLCDRRQPEILLTSPINGTVTAIHRGARRRLISLEITANDTGNGLQFDIPATLDQDNI